MLSHTIVLCVNYLKKAIETFGLKPKYIELFYELLCICNCFYKTADGVKVKLIKSLQSDMFNQNSLWESLINYDIEMQINY